MAAKGTATTPADAKKVTEPLGVRFVTCDLTPEQKAILVAWVAELDTEEWVGWLTSTVTLGHVVSVRSNEVGYQCAVTGGIRDGSVHSGLSLVARASTPLKALQAAMFKDQNVLAGVWPVTDRKSELDL